MPRKTASGDRKRGKKWYLPRPDGLTIRQIAEVMGISEGTVRNIQDDAFYKLRKELTKGE